MFVGAAVCPHPPLLVPEVGTGAAGELDDLRTSCFEAVRLLASTRPDVVVCVGGAPALRRFPDAAVGSLRGLGVHLRAGSGDAGDAAGARDAGDTGGAEGLDGELPLSLTLGAWLLDRYGWEGARRYVALPRELSGDECAALGRVAADRDGMRVGVLAMGDGTAKRSEHAPGYVDHRAGALDQRVADALAHADREWLVRRLDPGDCADLWVAGRQAWQFLAGAAESAPPGADIAAKMHYDAAPYGVGYFVASWLT
ncbi:MAG: hypothetical protein GEU93_10030 [Propionibacteriales bacterium]|nr:hypothetical protein [Propionibacteriales bacterium]